MFRGKVIQNVVISQEISLKSIPFPVVPVCQRAIKISLIFLHQRHAGNETSCDEHPSATLQDEKSITNRKEAGLFFYQRPQLFFSRHISHVLGGKYLILPFCQCV